MQRHWLTGEALDKNRKVCCEQPKPIAPPTFDFENIRPALRTSRPLEGLAERRTLASRASSRTSFIPRRARRATIGSIGAPYDFKRVELPRERDFRPLILSIHIPGNELLPLPEFDEAICDDDAGLMFPPPALTKSRSESMLSRPSTAFTIPRKPVPSRAVSLDVLRSDMESQYTSNGLCRGPQAIPRRPSIPPSQSKQDFLDPLDAHLPQSPPLLRSKSGPEPVYTLYRRASEQNLRLRAHLEERSQIERRFPECDTTLEGKEGDLERSPVFAHSNNAAAPEESTPLRKCTQPRSTEWFRTPFAPLQPPAPSTAVPAPSFLALVQPPLILSTRTRVSQWLRSSPIASPTKPPRSTPAPTPLYSLHQSSVHDRTSNSSSLYSSSTAVELTTASTAPRSSPHRKGRSLSSCSMNVQVVAGALEGQKVRGVDVEIRDVGVGVAF